MKPIKITGLCLVAVFVMSMVASESAFAEAKPYLIQCREVKPGTGHWKDKQCQKEPGAGNFETREAGSQGDETFSSTSGKGSLETVGKKKITCTADTDTGKLSSFKQVKEVFVTFTGCKEEVKKVECANAAKEEIRTKELEGHLVYINKGTVPPKVGLLLKPVAGGTGFFAEFKCTAALTVKVKGAVIGQLTPVNEMTEMMNLEFKQAAGIQEPTKTESGEEAILTSIFTGPVEEQSGLETKDTMKFQFDVAIVA